MKEGQRDGMKEAHGFACSRFVFFYSILFFLRYFYVVSDSMLQILNEGILEHSNLGASISQHTNGHSFSYLLLYMVP